MYSVSVRQKFITQHYLPNETGKERIPHSHHYSVEVCVYGEKLNAHGFLVDIVDLKRTLDHLIQQLSDRLLNDLKEFHGKNPSLENLASVLWNKIIPHIESNIVDSVKVTVWEEEHIYASYEGIIAKRTPG
jgi:6-pyruvoyltetrahydropterin/6-carboxytetrahydropterin synthase